MDESDCVIYAWSLNRDESRLLVVTDRHMRWFLTQGGTLVETLAHSRVMIFSAVTLDNSTFVLGTTVGGCKCLTLWRLSPTNHWCHVTKLSNHSIIREVKLWIDSLACIAVNDGVIVCKGPDALIRIAPHFAEMHQLVKSSEILIPPRVQICVQC
jgi:hypothetical protein